MSGSSGATRLKTTDFSRLVGQTAVQIWPFPPLQGHPISYMRIYNVSNATIWCSRAGDAVVGGAGSFPLQAGIYELWVAPGPIPTNALSIISTADATPVTIEVG